MCTGLIRYPYTAGAQDWQDIRTHRECTRLDSYMNTQSGQDWSVVGTHRVHKTGQM